MAVSIDWPTSVITVPRADMTLIQTNPTEIRTLDTNAFRIELRGLEESDDGRAWSITHTHNADETVGGITLADVLKIVDPYTITFEDGQYAVYLQGTNNNILEKTNKNQVSVNPNNSAGLITVAEIQYAAYGDGISIDVVGGESGQLYPIGTKSNPVDNMADAIFINDYMKLDQLYIKSSMTFGVDADIDDFKVIGHSHIDVIVTVEDAAITSNVLFNEVIIQGILDGDNDLTRCTIRDILYFSGHIHNCSLNGTITLGNTGLAYIENSKILDPDKIPIINMGGTGHTLSMPGYIGKVYIENMTGGNANIGLNEGIIILKSTVTGGIISAVGVGRIIDEAGNDIWSGTWNGATIINQAVSNESIERAVWEASEGLIVRKMLENKVIKSGDVITIYDDDGVSVWKEYNLADGGRVLV